MHINVAVHVWCVAKLKIEHYVDTVANDHTNRQVSVSSSCMTMIRTMLIYIKWLYHSSDIKPLTIKASLLKRRGPQIFSNCPDLAFLKWGICPRPPSLPYPLELPRRPEASFVAVSLRQLFHLAAKKAKPWRKSGGWVGDFWVQF